MKDLGNGYYIPDKEDIQLGMRIEFQSPYSSDAWTVEPFLEIEDLPKAFNLLKKGYARCKYLTEADLLAEGWEKICEGVYEKGKVGMWYSIIMDFECNTATILKGLSGMLRQTIYVGDMYSINDYFTIIKLLRI